MKNLLKSLAEEMVLIFNTMWKTSTVNPFRLHPGQRKKIDLNFTLLCGASKGFMKALQRSGTTKKCENKNVS